MSAVNRFQALAACAVVVFVLGAVRAVAILAGSSQATRPPAFTIASSGQVAIRVPHAAPFAEIEVAVARNPFEAPSQWRPPPLFRSPGDRRLLAATRDVHGNGDGTWVRMESGRTYPTPDPARRQKSWLVGATRFSPVMVHGMRFEISHVVHNLAEAPAPTLVTGLRQEAYLQPCPLTPTS